MMMMMMMRVKYSGDDDVEHHDGDGDHPEHHQNHEFMRLIGSWSTKMIFSSTSTITDPWSSARMPKSATSGAGLEVDELLPIGGVRCQHSLTFGNIPPAWHDGRWAYSCSNTNTNPFVPCMQNNFQGSFKEWHSCAFEDTTRKSQFQGAQEIGRCSTVARPWRSKCDTEIALWLG